MPGTLQPLDPQFAIADLQGRPTLYFIKWAQQKQIDITGSAQLDGGNDFTGDQNIDGNLTVTDGGVTLKANPTSLGFTIADRAVVPGHQINFISNAPITGGGAVLNVFAAKSSAAAKNVSQIALWTVPPTDPSIVQGAIRAATGASGEELILLTQQFGAAGLIAGDIVFEPNAIEKLRIVSAAGDPAVKVTGQLSVTDDPYSASWDGSTDVPTKNAVYDKIQTMGGGGGALVLLEQHTAAASASLDFTTAISATYDEYLIEFVNILPATNAVKLYMRMSTNGGVSYDAAGNYSYSALSSNRFSTSTVGADSGATQIQLINSSADNTVTGGGIHGSLRLFSPASAAQHKGVRASLMFVTGGTVESCESSGFYRSVIPVNAFQFLMSAGNIASGTIRVYGIAK